MTLLESVKIRLGVFYSEENKDNELRQMIKAATNYFKRAGWDFTALLLSKTEKELIVSELQTEIAETLLELEQEELTESEIIALNETLATIEDSLDLALAELEAIDISLETEAIVLYCKMAQSTDPVMLTNHPVLISFISQNRGDTDVEV